MGNPEGAWHEALHARAQAAEALMRRLSSETRFILAVVSGELAVSSRRKADIVADLAAAGYDQLPPSRKVRRPCMEPGTCPIFPWEGMQGLPAGKQWRPPGTTTTWHVRHWRHTTKHA